VDVARPLFDGLRDGRIDQPDDGRFARHVAQPLQVLVRLAFQTRLRRFFLRLAVVTVDGVENLPFGGEHGLDAQTREAAHGGDGLEIERIAHGDAQRGILERERNETALPHETRREPFGFLSCGRRAVDRDQRHVQLFRERGQQVPHRDKAQIDENPADFFAAFLLDLERPLQILWRDEPPLDQHFANALHL